MSETPRLAEHDTHGLYPLMDSRGRIQQGLLARDGSVLSHTIEGFLVSVAWRDPACDGCYRSRFYSMLPHSATHCRQHGPMRLDADMDTWDLTATERLQVERRVWSTIAGRWNVRARYRAITLENGKPTDAMEIAREVARADRDDDAFLDYFAAWAGPTGIGKTAAVTALFRDQAVWQCDDPVFFEFPALVRLFIGKGSLRDAEGDELDPLTVCIESDCLYLDDVGAAHLKEDGLAASLFEEVIVAREAERRTTLITTNLTPRAFRAEFGDRIADRVFGDWGVWHSIKGPSLRRNANAVREIGALSTARSRRQSGSTSGFTPSPTTASSRSSHSSRIRR